MSGEKLVLWKDVVVPVQAYIFSAAILIGFGSWLTTQHFAVATVSARTAKIEKQKDVLYYMCKNIEELHVEIKGKLPPRGNDPCDPQKIR